MPALTLIISGDSKPLQRELAAVQKMAAQATANVQRSAGGHHVGTAGIVNESLVLIREMSAGNFNRAPGSLSILLQRMGLLKLILKDTAAVSGVLASAWAEQAAKASIAAVAATRKAAASTAALYAEGGETEATLAAAIADEQKAASSILNAQATQAKAVASAEAAAAANAESVATKAAIGPLGIVVGILAALAAGVYAAYKLTGFLVDKLTGLKVPDFNADYIAKQLQAINQSLEGQKDITREVLKTVDAYNSAAEAAKRVAETTKDHFDHLLKMNDLQKRAALAGDNTPAKRIATEKKFADQEAKIRADRRREEMFDKGVELANLKSESDAKKRAADAIAVGSSEHDANVVSVAKARADAARQYLVESAKPKTAKERYYEFHNSASDSGVSKKDLEEAENQKRQQAVHSIQAYRSAVDQKASNDELRRRKEELTKGAGTSAAAAAKLSLEMSDRAKTNERTAKEEAEESAAKIAVEAVRKQKGSGGGFDITANQRIGAFIGGASNPLLDVQRRTLHHVASIDSKMGNSKSGAHSPFRRESY